jgi:hypothetical protein
VTTVKSRPVEPVAYAALTVIVALGCVAYFATGNRAVHSFTTVAGLVLVAWTVVGLFWRRS